MTIDGPTFFSIYALALSLINLLTSSRKDAGALEKRITALETKVEIFWKNVSLDAAQLLHRPHEGYERRDELIEKYIADKMTEEELKEFVKMLEDTRKHGEDRQERFYASYLLNTIKARFDFI